MVSVLTLNEVDSGLDRVKPDLKLIFVASTLITQDQGVRIKNQDNVFKLNNYPLVDKLLLSSHRIKE